MGQRLRLSLLRNVRRTLSLLHSPRCSLLPGVSPRNSPHGRHGHGTHAHAALGLVLGGLLGCRHHPECRPSSSSGNSGCLATKRPFRFSTSCAPAWCARTRIGSGASPRNTSRPTKPMSVGVPAARGEAYTTWFSWPARSKSASASSKGAVTNAEPGATQGVFALPLRRIAAPSRWAVHRAYRCTRRHHHHRRLEWLREAGRA